MTTSTSSNMIRRSTRSVSLTRVGIVLALAGAVQFLILLSRANRFGISFADGMISALMAAGLFVPVVRGLRINKISCGPARLALRIALLTFVTSHEVYYGAQDLLFYKQVQDSPYDPRFEPRWAPFGSLGLHYYPVSGSIFVVD